MLRRQGVIDVWHDRRIAAGDEFDHAISTELEKADVILLLVSPDFLASDYCYDVEVKRAMERHDAKLIRVIPVILRPCDWHGAPFGKLLAAPKDGKPVTRWPDLDEAFLDVTQAIKEAVGSRGEKEKAGIRQAPRAAAPQAPELPRSSNLRVQKEFSDVERDRFLDGAFDFISKYFEGSLQELTERHPEVDTGFKRIDAQQFTAQAYKGGKAVSRCRIALGRTYGRAGEITFAYDDSPHGGVNEFLSVEADDQGMFIKTMGMQHIGGVGNDARLTYEGAAEYYWSLFIAPLQR